MIYGYVRVSTATQDETGQVRQLKVVGCEKIFREKITGTTADRPQLKRLINHLAPGDVVITPAVDRLSRDTTDLLNIAHEMQKAGFPSFGDGHHHPSNSTSNTTADVWAFSPEFTKARRAYHLGRFNQLHQPNYILVEDPT
jgi:hypothetical protein